MATRASFTDLHTLCEQHDCAPSLRCETRDGRTWWSLSAIQKVAPYKTLYDNRADVDWDNTANAATLLDTALKTWWQ